MSSDQAREAPLPSGSEAGSPTAQGSHVDPELQLSPRAKKPQLPKHEPLPRHNVNFSEETRPPDSLEGQLSPAAADRVFPIRSVVSVDPAPPPTPAQRSDKSNEGYFQNASQTRRQARKSSLSSGRRPQSESMPARERQASTERTEQPKLSNSSRADISGNGGRQGSMSAEQSRSMPSQERRQSAQFFNDMMAETGSNTSGKLSGVPSDRPSSRSTSYKSNEDAAPLITTRFTHVITEGGHAIITGRDGETMQRCEDEPIHIPGAVQGFGMLIALEEQTEGRFIVRVVSENSKRMIGYTPKQLFALDSFTDILSEEQADNLLDHVDFIRDDDADVATNGPEVFTMSMRTPHRKTVKMWCAMHINDKNSNLIICEFELEDDPLYPLVPPSDMMTPEIPEDTLNSMPTREEFLESTQNSSKPLRVLRSARKRKGEAAAMEVFNIMSQVQEQLAAAPNLEQFLKVLVGVVKELTGFHRVMIYQFDQNWSGRVVTELVDPRTTKDLYKGLNFPASDIPKQARELYKINKVRMLYDRDQETARLVCRTVEDLETPLDLTYSYLRAMSPIHLKYLSNMGVRSSMSISINAFEELWGLISCHSYGAQGMRVSFPIRKMCRLIGDSASRNIERLSYASRLQARKLINTVPTQNNPSGYIIASSEDLLKLFDADFGLLSIRDETKVLGDIEQTQEALAMLEYLRLRRITNVMTSQDIREDFPDLRYAPGFTVIAGLLLVPLSAGGQDFIVFFRKGQLKEVKWAGNPYEKLVKDGTEGYLEPRKSFKMWSETVVGKCRDWTEEEVETAAVLCLVYGKFIEVWRQKEAALQSSQLTRLLLANSAHEVRTPLNAIINYLEIALEGSLDQETRENLAKSHSASKSLIYVINDLLDLTKTEPGGELTKDEVFDLKSTLIEATDMFKGDARRKNISYEVVDFPGLPAYVIGDQRRVRQAISNVTANAIQNTIEGGVKVEMYLANRQDNHVDIEVSVSDTGAGMNAKKLDALFRELEQVQSVDQHNANDRLGNSRELPEQSHKEEGRTLGLGLAVVARIIRNMNGQLRLKSEEKKGSRFIILFPFDLPDIDKNQRTLEGGSEGGSSTPHAEFPSGRSTPPVLSGEVTLIDRGSVNRRSSQDGSRPRLTSRKSSTESITSRRSASIRSGRSNFSRSSAASGKSEADRLIEAIQQPHSVEGPHTRRSGSRRSIGSGSSIGLTSPTRPRLDKRHSTTNFNQDGSPIRSEDSLISPVRYDQMSTKAGESIVEGQGIPIRPVKVLDDFVGAGDTENSIASTSRSGSLQKARKTHPEIAKQPSTAEQMKVLVAEDDPVNSKIIKKRLERLGHEIYLTINGEECFGLYCEKAGFFDIVLMDMQVCSHQSLLIESHN